MKETADDLYARRGMKEREFEKVKEVVRVKEVARVKEVVRVKEEEQEVRVPCKKEV